MNTQLINDHFNESLIAHLKTQELAIIDINNAINLTSSTLQRGNKILVCGNGGSAADGEHFVAEFNGRFETERDPLPVISLTANSATITAIANDYGVSMIFTKQVIAFGKANDVLYAISTSGNSENIISAIHTAHSKGIKVIALLGADGGHVKNILLDVDIAIHAQSKRTARIQEVHSTILHIICDAVDTIMQNA